MLFIAWSTRYNACDPTLSEGDVAAARAKLDTETFEARDSECSAWRQKRPHSVSLHGAVPEARKQSFKFSTALESAGHRQMQRTLPLGADSAELAVLERCRLDGFLSSESLFFYYFSIVFSYRRSQPARCRSEGPGIRPAAKPVRLPLFVPLESSFSRCWRATSQREAKDFACQKAFETFHLAWRNYSDYVCLDPIHASLGTVPWPRCGITAAGSPRVRPICEVCSSTSQAGILHQNLQPLGALDKAFLAKSC